MTGNYKLLAQATIDFDALGQICNVPYPLPFGALPGVRFYRVQLLGEKNSGIGVLFVVDGSTSDRARPLSAQLIDQGGRLNAPHLFTPRGSAPHYFVDLVSGSPKPLFSFEAWGDDA